MLDVDKSEITLTNKVGNEEIIISANVNHSVDGGGGDGDPSMEKETPGGIRAKPNFDVEVKKGNQTLVFSCSFLPNEMEGGQEDFEDVFVIGEVSLFDGEAKKTDYAIAGDILDEYLYDLFMNFLEDRGISNEFISKFSELCTNYEHYLYIELMVNLQKFLKEEV
ncbi:Complement component 1 Q subcomponent-binding protein, mitochondrial [Orchesella cincta]|uniref:Complement component 1 Q subcomponent-binding protein, mitochondrial n=1 Tax=Orchesella cincta TaxID=48709 RepID=A0A1D2M523_ORCCI|nr:Complement component 1 Q subcomponent-binding protein, mitochondrial [Orchesella cincta]